MKTVNPLGRIPETEETMAQAGCHCVCNVESGNHDITGLAAWVPLIPDCFILSISRNIKSPLARNATSIKMKQIKGLVQKYTIMYS